jgi:hypothetical protein
MITTMLKKPFIYAALLIAGAAGLAGPANAIVVNGTWDPKYGSPFEGSNTSSTGDDMWWSGAAFFYIPDTCTIAANGTLTTATCAGMSVTSATVELRLGQGGSLLDTLQFNAPTAVSEVGFNSSGNVSYVISDWFDPLQQGTSSTLNLASYLFSLSFDVQGAMLFHTSLDAYLEKHGGHGPDDKSYFWQGEGIGHIGDLCSPSNIPGGYDGDNCGFSDSYGTMVFAPIPEPSTYALMLAGLAAIGFVARRRRSRRSLAPPQ